LTSSLPPPAARRVARVLVALFVVALIGLTVAAVTYRPRMERWLTVKVVEVLEDRLDSDVQLDAISVQPGLITRISGGPLTIRHRRHTEVAPLLRIERFETTLTWRQMLRRPRRVDAVTLTGVAIAIPPSRRPETPSDAEQAADNGQPATARQASEDQPATAPAVIIDRVTADAATLVILPRELKKLPRRFVLHKLTVRDISSDRPMGFDAVVENPKPRGRIHTTGTFGPWNAVVPARTPLDARYKFVDADLSTIPGIAGILQAEGTYGGQLERIEAIGTSTTPNFDLEVGGRPLSVKTRFTVVVDGTNGNTYIQPAEAVLGEGTPIRVTGGVVKAEDRRGRTVDLAMSIADGRLEEVLALVVNGEPTMKGRIRVDASLLIPPGPEKVVRRMVLEGKFSLAGTRFTSRVLQARIDELSRRAQGKLDDPDITRVVSAFSGRFRMADGVIRFPVLSFEVDGARVQLAGRYVVAGQGLNFDGRIQLAAGVSQMVRGRKAWLLRPFDGLFRRDGYTEFPIHIRGTVEKPEFGVDVKQTLGRALLPGR
jgi:hypothetical protein